ncbi:hypothetical protein [Spirosoma oryzicola]|uniref:hypothetical protein n=1 Tax=Spirosoma oryzicola TaxID=2898794 RepID=UPI001E4D44BB|nr:hypothetical protein [Spirosoma oryzicola]UHG93419.1 hypothetical protein LQ777_11055 [Spirosoma oryzicola]
MPQHWKEKATVQSAIANALVGIIPATIVAIAAILVQVHYADKQIKINEVAARSQDIKDSLNTVRAAEQYKNDSLLALQQLKLNQLQFELAAMKRKDDMEQGRILAEINGSQVDVLKAQLKFADNNNRVEVLKNLNQFGRNLKKYGDVVNSQKFYNSYTMNDTQPIRYILTYLQEQSNNPILFEDPDLLRGFYLNIYRFNSTLAFTLSAKDSLQNDNIFDDYEHKARIEYHQIREFYVRQKEFYESMLYRYLKIRSGQKIIGYELETQW